MLPKKYRFELRKNIDFFNQAVKIHNRLFSLYYIKAGEQDFKATIIISKNEINLVTKRNEVKRILSEIILNIIKNQSLKNTSVALVVRSSIRAESKTNIEENLTKMFKKAGLTS